MNASSVCTSCGSDLLSSDDAPSVCVPCALSFALGDVGEGFPTTPLPAGVVSEPAPIERIGPYFLRKVLGEGGMGIVWEAEQQEPVRRRVALKRLRGGMDGTQILARFESERQALALMSHPNIAHALDAGCSEDGHPYFAMELIEGPWITRYSDAERLDVRRRLELFMDVCRAIQHAHQKGVIHRDIKPSNILVQTEGGRPVPKVIDFGVAKAIGAHLTDRTLMTQIGQRVGTLEYMSPEQAGPGGFDVDTRTDVYSLGTLLYELLTGRIPFDAPKGDADELRRRIREDEPLRPSARVAALGTAAVEVARLRGTQPTSLSKSLRGDLDWIVLKALAKDRPRRYGSPEELAADIGRYLTNEPVTAGPPSAIYRARKFVRRHRGMVAGLAGIVLALTAGLVASTLLYFRSEESRGEATAVAQFLGGMLAGVSPRGGSKDITVREVLDRASATVSVRFKEQPLVEAYLHQVIASSYQDLGVWNEAEKHAAEAARLRRDALGDEDPSRLESMLLLAYALDRQAKSAEANAVLDELIPLSRRTFGDESRETLEAVFRKAVVLLEHGSKVEAEAMHRQVYAIRRRVLGDDHPNTLLSAYYLAETALRQGRAAEAEVLLRQVLRDRRRVLGPEHPDTLHTMNNLAWALNEQGKYAEAVALNQQTLEIRRRVLGNQNPDTLMSMHLLAHSVEHLSRHQEAQKLFLEAVEGDRKVLGDGHPRTLEAMDCYAWWLLTCAAAELQNPKAALALAQRVVEGSQRRVPYFLDTLALALRETGDIKQAVTTQQASLAHLLASSSSIGPELELELAKDLMEARRLPALAPLLLSLHEMRSGAGVDSPDRLHEFMALVIKLYDTWNGIEPAHRLQVQAAAWRSRLEAGR